MALNFNNIKQGLGINVDADRWSLSGCFRDQMLEREGSIKPKQKGMDLTFYYGPRKAATAAGGEVNDFGSVVFVGQYHEVPRLALCAHYRMMRH